MYDIKLNLPPAWVIERDSYNDESGCEVARLEAHLPDDAKKVDEGVIDILVGEMPSDTTAADEAMANYVDMVGFDEGEEESDPIIEWPFNGRKAYGFEALCEDESPVRVMCMEVRKGVLCVMNIIASDDEKLVEFVRLVERGLRIK